MGKSKVDRSKPQFVKSAIQPTAGAQKNQVSSLPQGSPTAQQLKNTGAKPEGSAISAGVKNTTV